ncbi:25999_t:CDS:2, partial [Racocetra persica]
MVIISYSFKTITIFGFIICLITLVESQFKCPSIPNSQENPQTFIIQLSSPNVVNNHSAFLKSCYNKDISNNINQLIDPKIIKIISFGSFICYIGRFNPSEAASLAILPEVVNVENDKTLHISAPQHIRYNDYTFTQTPTETTTEIPTETSRENPAKITTKIPAETPTETPTKTLTKISTTVKSTHTLCPLFATEPLAPTQSPQLDRTYTYPNSAGSGVNVYIVDTGVNIDNVEFGKRATLGPAFCNECPNIDDHGHGTNVAGIVGGTQYGVAKLASLISIKVCTGGGSCQYSDIITALTYIGNQHNNSSNKNTVINISISGGFSQITNDAVEELIKKGIHVIIAAGNNAADACTVSPASAPNAIAVGATNTGTDITAAGNQSSTALSTYSGTSQACPHVAGTVALMISDSGNRSPAQMKTDLDNLSTKDVVTGLNASSSNRFLRVPYCQ